MKQQHMEKLCMILFFIVALFLCGCGKTEGTGEIIEANASTISEDIPHSEELPIYAELSFEPTGDVTYATRFCLEKSGEYERITLVDGETILLIPEEGVIPAGVPQGMVILQKPIRNAYLASSSVFDLIKTLDVMDTIRFSGVKKNDLYIDTAKEALESESMFYAGKYSMPDYELLVQKQCDLAIENTMIYHTPETKEKLEQLGMPVLVEQSSYENHPLGRMEWIKVYGMIFGREEEAQALFQQQVEEILPIMQKENTGFSVAFFYVNSNGVINVRKPGDYITKMIALSGGEYVIHTQAEEENALSTMNMQMEDFFLAAKDADIIIYNSTINGKLDSIDSLVKMNSVFQQFKAVKENRVYTTDQNFFQETWGMGDFMKDLDLMLRGEEEAEYTYLVKVN